MVNPVYCIKCKQPLDATDVFCKHCGADQRPPSQQPSFLVQQPAHQLPVVARQKSGLAPAMVGLLVLVAILGGVVGGRTILHEREPAAPPAQNKSPIARPATQPQPITKPQPVNEPFVIKKVDIEQMGPILIGRRSWFVTVEVQNNTNQVSPVPVPILKFDDYSSLPTLLPYDRFDGAIPHGVDLQATVIGPGTLRTLTFYADDSGANDAKKPKSLEMRFGNITVERQL